MDAFAKGFKTAYKMLWTAGSENIAERYKSYSEGIGKEIVEGRADLILFRNTRLNTIISSILPQAGSP